MTATASALANTPIRAIKNALVDAGYLGRNRDPTSEQLADGMARLNDIFQGLQTRGLKVWLQYDLQVTPVVGQVLYSFGPTGNVIMTKPMRVLEGYYIDNNQNRRPLIPMSRNEWDTLSTVSTQGTVTSYFAQKNQLTLDVYLWLTPDTTAATGFVHLLIQQQVGTVSMLTDTMNFPQEWFLTLEWTLASQLAIGQPESIAQRCDAQAQFWLTTLEGWDVEDASTFLAPDTRTMAQLNRFT